MGKPTFTFVSDKERREAIETVVPPTFIRFINLQIGMTIETVFSFAIQQMLFEDGIFIVAIRTPKAILWSDGVIDA